MKNVVSSPRSSFLTRVLLTAFAVLVNAWASFGQDVPVFLRSNYVERRIIKTKSDDFGVTRLAKGYFVFCSNGRKGISKLIKRPKIDLFLYDLSTDKVSAFDKSGLCEIENSKYNIGSISFSSDLKNVFLSRNRDLKNYEGYIPFELVQVDIADETSECSVLSFVNSDYSYQQPFYDTKTETLFFVSNMPGGRGGYDIYFTKRLGKYGWSAVQSLDYANSPNDDLFPSMDADNNFYFSRQVDARGLEIFCLTNGSRIPIALPGPFNTLGDDFNLSVIDKRNIVLARVPKKNGDSDIFLYTLK